jgi:adenylate kinase family enzyme
MRRVSVVGNTGSGKTVLAKALAARLGVQYVELDAIFHQPNWTPLPTDEFRRRVADAVVGDAWVVDGNYSSVRDLVWRRADAVIWLDLSRVMVMRQLVARTLRRMATGEELWNANRERWRSLFDADESIIAWAWTQHAKYHTRYAAAAADPANGHLTFVRLGSRAEVNRFLRSVRVATDAE